MREKHFALAQKISRLSSHHSHKLGAVIAKRNKVVSVGYNQIKTHPVSTHPYQQLHAEIVAVIKADQDLHDCEIYVYRENKNGRPAISKPCRYCQLLLKEVGIKKVYFTNSEGYQSFNL